MDSMKLRKFISDAKYIYTLVYIVSFSLFYNSFIHCYLYKPTQLLYQGLVILGVVILAADFFTSGILTRVKHGWLLVLFYLACLLSIAANLNYDPVGNVKVVIWMLIQTFVFSALDAKQDKEYHKRYFRIITEAFSFVWLVGAAISVVMFVIGFEGIIIDPDPSLVKNTVRIGFLEGRLFGVFSDPNYASVCIIFSMFMTACNMQMFRDNTAFRIYHIILFVIDFIFIVLAKSRTAEICSYVAIALAVFFIVKSELFTKAKMKSLLRYGASALAALLSVIILMSAFSFASFAMDKLYISVGSSMSGDVDEEELEQELIRPDVEYSNDITNHRAEIWSDYYKVFEKNAIFGTGPRNGLAYAKENMPNLFIVQKGYYYHNGYLAVLVGTGIVGSIIMLAFMLLNVVRIVLYLAKRGRDRDDLYKPVVILSSMLVVGAVMALPLMAIFFNNSACDAIFWFVLGFVNCLIRISDNDEKPELFEKLTKFMRPRIKE